MSGQRGVGVNPEGVAGLTGPHTQTGVSLGWGVRVPGRQHGPRPEPVGGRHSRDAVHLDILFAVDVAFTEGHPVRHTPLDRGTPPS